MKDPASSFPGSLGRALSYPVSSWGGVFFLASCTALHTLSRALPVTGRKNPRIYLFVFAALLTASYLYRVVNEVVEGKERAPRLRPDAWEDAWLDLLHYCGGLLVAFLPVWVLLLYSFVEQRGHLERQDFRAALVVCLFLGTAYLPMALLMNGFTQEFATAFNLGIGFRSIRTMGADYAACCIYFLAGHAAWLLLEAVWVAQTPPGWNSARVTAAAVTSLFGLYVFVLQMRVLGLAYRRHHDALGWSLGKGA
jgi:hypothetical protein